ncbi:MAG: flagellin [Sphingomonadaceae bacterium]
MQINTNLSSLNAQHAYRRAGEGLAVTLHRLSSGQRINSATDDAAGLSITERMGASVRGLAQAGRNVNDGISLLQVAEGAVGQVVDNFQRIRELAVQAANDTNSASDRRALQQEVDLLVKSNQEISASAKYNGLSLLDGSFATRLQVGAGVQDTLDVAIPQLYAPAGLGSVSVEVPELQVNLQAQANLPLTVGALAINGTAIGASVAGSQVGQSSASAYAVAAAINSAAPPGGIAASASTTLSGTVVPGGVLAGGSVSINGVALGAISGANGNARAAAAAAAINGAAGGSGVSASASGATLTLTAADGRDVSIGGAGAAALGLGGGVHRGVVTVLDTPSGLPHTVSIGGSNPGAAGFTAGLQASSADGNTVTVLRPAGSGGEPAIDLSSYNGATLALDYIDAKLDSVNDLRGYLGATQNRLQLAYNDTTSQSSNLATARSRIRDTDYASETAQLTRSQILQQAGASMVAQANAQPQQALLLLR